MKSSHALSWFAALLFTALAPAIRVVKLGKVWIALGLNRYRQSRPKNLKLDILDGVGRGELEGNAGSGRGCQAK
jgi:hypothetical protein